MTYRHFAPQAWLLQLGLVLIALFATPTAAAQDPAPADLDPDVRAQIERAAIRLAEQGLSLDLGALAVVIESRETVRLRQQDDLKASFGAARANTYRILLQSYGRQYETGEDLLTGLAKRRARGLIAHYRPSTKQVVLVSEELGTLGERELELTQALVLAARHQAGAALFEAVSNESFDQLVAREAVLFGGSAAAASKAVSPDASIEDSWRWLRGLELAPLDAEIWRQGILGLRGVVSEEALAGLWSERLSSSEQLMHLIKRRRDLPEQVSLPPWPEKLTGARVAHEDTFGEVVIQALLMELGVPRPRAESAATGWDGDRLRHVVTAEGDDVIVWRTVWDRPADAQLFAQEYSRRAGGQVVINGRVVDWVQAEDRGVWKRVLKGLAAQPHAGEADPKDAVSTKRIEDEAFESRRSAPYVVANEWRHPSLDLTVVVPVGWYEDERDGRTYMVRTKTAGYRDNVHVTASMVQDGKSIPEVLAINEQRLRADQEHDFMSAERRTMADGREVGLLRYQRHEGGHDVIFSTLVILRERAQIGVTIGIELDRWEKSLPMVEQILSEVRLGEVKPLER